MQGIVIFVQERVVEILNEVGLFIRSQHQIDALNLAHFFTLQLCIAACHDDECTGILAHHFVDGLSTFMVGHFGHAAGIDEADVSLLIFLSREHTHVGQHLAESGGL